jgi:hypothetical protein
MQYKNIIFASIAVSKVTGYMVAECGLIPGRERDFLITITLRLDLGTVQPPNK